MPRVLFAPARSCVIYFGVTVCGERIDILGVRVHRCGEAAAAARIGEFLREVPARLRQVCTVNPEFVMEARRNAAFRLLLNSVDLATPDGVGIVAAARLLGTPVEGRATGVALVGHIARMSARKGYSLFLLGAAPGVADQAAQALIRRHGAVRIAGAYPGSPRDEDWPEIRSRLEQAQPDVLLVAYGAPAQDLWISRMRAEMPSSIKVAMGVGGVYDYLSGRVPFAPPWVRRIGLEWLYRLATQPWRMRRILRVFVFAALVWAEAVRRKAKREA